MKRFLIVREESDHILVEANSILEAYKGACDIWDHDIEDTSEIEIYDVGQKYLVKENKCKDPFVFTKTKK